MLIKYWKGQQAVAVTPNMIEDLAASPHFKQPSLVVDPHAAKKLNKILPKK